MVRAFVSEWQTKALCWIRVPRSRHLHDFPSPPPPMFSNERN